MDKFDNDAAIKRLNDDTARRLEGITDEERMVLKAAFEAKEFSYLRTRERLPPLSYQELLDRVLKETDLTETAVHAAIERLENRGVPLRDFRRPLS